MIWSLVRAHSGGNSEGLSRVVLGFEGLLAPEASASSVITRARQQIYQSDRSSTTLDPLHCKSRPSVSFGLCFRSSDQQAGKGLARGLECSCWAVSVRQRALGAIHPIRLAARVEVGLILQSHFNKCDCARSTDATSGCPDPRPLALDFLEPNALAPSRPFSKPSRNGDVLIELGETRLTILGKAR